MCANWNDFPFRELSSSWKKKIGCTCQLLHDNSRYRISCAPFEFIGLNVKIIDYIEFNGSLAINWNCFSDCVCLTACRPCKVVGWLYRYGGTTFYQFSIRIFGSNYCAHLAILNIEVIRRLDVNIEFRQHILFNLQCFTFWLFVAIHRSSSSSSAASASSSTIMALINFDVMKL